MILDKSPSQHGNHMVVLSIKKKKKSRCHKHRSKHELSFDQKMQAAEPLRNN